MMSSIQRKRAERLFKQDRRDRDAKLRQKHAAHAKMNAIACPDVDYVGLSWFVRWACPHCGWKR
jgi:hypothetical protein